MTDTTTDERTAFQRAVGDAETAASILNDLEGVEEDAHPEAHWELKLNIYREDLPTVRDELRELIPEAEQ